MQFSFKKPHRNSSQLSQMLLTANELLLVAAKNSFIQRLSKLLKYLFNSSGQTFLAKPSALCFFNAIVVHFKKKNQTVLHLQPNPNFQSASPLTPTWCHGQNTQNGNKSLRKSFSETH